MTEITVPLWAVIGTIVLCMMVGAALASMVVAMPAVGGREVPELEQDCAGEAPDSVRANLVHQAWQDGYEFRKSGEPYIVEPKTKPRRMTNGTECLQLGPKCSHLLDGHSESQDCQHHGCIPNLGVRIEVKPYIPDDRALSPEESRLYSLLADRENAKRGVA